MLNLGRGVVFPVTDPQLAEPAHRVRPETLAGGLEIMAARTLGDPEPAGADRRVGLELPGQPAALDLRDPRPGALGRSDSAGGPGRRGIAGGDPASLTEFRGRCHNARMSTETQAVPALTVLSEDETMFRDAVREFAQGEIRPRSQAMEQAKQHDEALI